MDMTTMLVHGDAEQHWESSVTPSIAQGTNWAFGSSEDLRAAASTPLYPFMYNRKGNPNHDQVAALIAAMEGGERALMTASGMSAITAAVFTLAKAGNHVIGQRSMYAGVTSMMLNLLPRLGIECAEVDQTDLAAFEAAVRPNTSLVLLETPSNPRLEITDLRAVAEIAHSHGALTLADNTLATPVNQRPLEHGIDIVWHSATKYLGGHSDLMAGAIVGSAEHVERIWSTSQVLGAVLAPFNAWLLLRGLRTMSLRMERHNANGMALAQALEGHPAVARVHYPGLPSHPGYYVATRQMNGYGGMLSFELVGGYAAAVTFISKLRLAKQASSLGHIGSLVIHPAGMWAETLSPDQLEAAGINPGLVRFATGIEHSDDVVADVHNALAACY